MLQLLATFFTIRPRYVAYEARRSLHVLFVNWGDDNFPVVSNCAVDVNLASIELCASVCLAKMLIGFISNDALPVINPTVITNSPPASSFAFDIVKRTSFLRFGASCPLLTSLEEVLDLTGDNLFIKRT